MSAGSRGLQNVHYGVLGALLCAALLAQPRRVHADVVEQAQAEFQQGVEATRAGRWLEARAAFMRSLELAERPSALYNLAVVDAKLGLAQEALQQLAAFEKLASSDQRPELWQRAERLRQRLEAELVASRPPVAHGGIEPILVAPLTGLAQEYLVAGQRAYERAQDALALEAFEAAYQSSGRVELLFNVGLAADRLRSDQRALHAYEAFAAALPELPKAVHARARVELLRSLLSERARPSAEVELGTEDTLASKAAPVVPPPVRRDERSLAAPRALLITGAALSAGAIVGGLWWRDRTNAIHECDDNPLCDNGAKLERQRRAASATTLVLGTVALGLVISGVLWLAQERRLRPAERAPFARTASFRSRAEARASTRRTSLTVRF